MIFLWQEKKQIHVFKSLQTVSTQRWGNVIGISFRRRLQTETAWSVSGLQLAELPLRDPSQH